MEKIFKPSVKPSNPYFSSGPCSKRPGWKIDNLRIDYEQLGLKLHELQMADDEEANNRKK